MPRRYEHTSNICLSTQLGMPLWRDLLAQLRRRSCSYYYISQWAREAHLAPPTTLLYYVFRIALYMYIYLKDVNIENIGTHLTYHADLCRAYQKFQISILGVGEMKMALAQKPQAIWQ